MKIRKTQILKKVYINGEMYMLINGKIQKLDVMILPKLIKTPNKNLHNAFPGI